VPAPTRRSLLVGAALLPVLTTLGCGGDETEDEPADRPRALTGDEAQLLAITRFRLYQDQTVPVRMDFPGEEKASVEATLDLRAGRGWGQARWDGAERLIGWSTAVVTTAPMPERGQPAPDQAEWTTRAVSTGVARDIFLLLALNLGSDRPENPALIQQGSARFLRHDEVDGTAVSVFSGPRPASEGSDATGSRTRYWVDAEGGLRRFEAYLGAADDSFVTLTRVEAVPAVPELAERVADVLAVAGAPRG